MCTLKWRQRLFLLFFNFSAQCVHLWDTSVPTSEVRWRNGFTFFWCIILELCAFNLSHLSGQLTFPAPAFDCTIIPSGKLWTTHTLLSACTESELFRVRNVVQTRSLWIFKYSWIHTRLGGVLCPKSKNGWSLPSLDRDPLWTDPLDKTPMDVDHPTGMHSCQVFFSVEIVWRRKLSKWSGFNMKVTVVFNIRKFGSIMFACSVKFNTTGRQFNNE